MALGRETSLDQSGFILLVMSVVFIMAGGNVINDYFDVETDAQNDRFNLVAVIGKRKTLLIYGLLSLSGLAYGFYLCLRMDTLQLWSVHILAFLLLLLYSNRLKSLPLVGNLLIALLCGVVPILPVLFENKSVEGVFQPSFFIVNFLGLLAFLATLVRELVKDIEDIEGDEKAGSMTLPLVIGISSSKSLALIFLSMMILLLLSVISFMTSDDMVSKIYLSVGLFFPSVYLFFKLAKTDDLKGFHVVSKGLKVLMLIGLFYGIVYHCIAL